MNIKITLSTTFHHMQSEMYVKEFKKPEKPSVEVNK